MIIIQLKRDITGEYLLVNDRYMIYLDDLTVYDMLEADDIPKYIFDIIDIFTENN